MARIRLVVGLGNPGPEYAATRHNVGFWWVEALARQQGMSLARDAKYYGQVARSKVGGEDLWLLLPETFMNLSGKSVGALARFFKILPAEILVVHDELDLPPGQLRLKRAGGHGGHNGLRDIIAALGNNEFWRLRIGIGHPGDKGKVSGYVLGAPSREDAMAIESAIDLSLGAADLLLAGEFERAMQRLHGKPSQGK